MLNFRRYDKYGQEILPGDICARSNRDKVELVIYKGNAYGKTPYYGRFISADGPVTLRYTSVVFAFDPMGNRRSRADEVNKIIRQYYESK